MPCRHRQHREIAWRGRVLYPMRAALFGHVVLRERTREGNYG